MLNMRVSSLYVLRDPESNAIRYVGQTVRRPSDRLHAHMKAARERTTPRLYAWIRGLTNIGRKPLMQVVAVNADFAVIDALEIATIRGMRKRGFDLLNIAHGGQGNRGYRHTDQQRQKWSRERRGERAPHYGHRHTDECKRKQSEFAGRWILENGHPNKGRKASAETKAKISKGRKGITPNRTDLSIEAHKQMMRARWADPAWRQKMHEIHASKSPLQERVIAYVQARGVVPRSGIVKHFHHPARTAVAEMIDRMINESRLVRVPFGKKTRIKLAESA